MMAKSIISVLLISVTIAQSSWAKPTTSEGDVCQMKSKYDTTESNPNVIIMPSYQVLSYIRDGLKKLSLKYVNGGKSISEQLLKNNEILNSKSAKILEFKQNLTKFEEQYFACDGLDALFKLAESYSNTTSFYYELEEASLDDDSKLILGLLRKYNSEVLDDEFEKFFDIFVEEFLKKFESLKLDLIREDLEPSPTILSWVAHFKRLTNYDDKIKAFKYFISAIAKLGISFEVVKFE